MQLKKNKKENQANKTVQKRKKTVSGLKYFNYSEMLIKSPNIELKAKSLITTPFVRIAIFSSFIV